jgi:hypothetical protein
MLDRESNLKLVLIYAQFRVIVVAQTTFCQACSLLMAKLNCGLKLEVVVISLYISMKAMHAIAIEYYWAMVTLLHNYVKIRTYLLILQGPIIDDFVTKLW